MHCSSSLDREDIITAQQKKQLQPFGYNCSFLKSGNSFLGDCMAYFSRLGHRSPALLEANSSRNALTVYYTVKRSALLVLPRPRGYNYCTTKKQLQPFGYNCSFLKSGNSISSRSVSRQVLSIIEAYKSVTVFVRFASKTVPQKLYF